MGGSCCSVSSQDTPKLIKSFSPPSTSTPWTYASGFDIDSTNRLLLSGWNTQPFYKLYDLETLEQVGSFDSEVSDDKRVFTCSFLSNSVCAVSSSHQLEIFNFKREDPPKEKGGESIKISGFTHIKTLPLDPSVSGNSYNHTILSLNSIFLNNNNNNSAQLVLASHRESCLSFWKTPNKNQLDDGNQYHQVGFFQLEKTYNISATSYCRAKFVNSSSSFCSSSSENYASFVCTCLSGFCLFKVSWSENEQKQEEEVNIELLRKIELLDSVNSYEFSNIDVARNFVVAHTAYDIGYLYDLSNFRVVSEIKATAGGYSNFTTIKISEDADVVVVGTLAGNIHFFSQENNWKEVLFQQKKPAIEFGNNVLDLHLCCDRHTVIAGGFSTPPMKIYHAPLLGNRWKRRRIVFLLQSFCGLRKTKQMLDLYRVRECIALFL